MLLGGATVSSFIIQAQLVHIHNKRMDITAHLPAILPVDV